MYLIGEIRGTDLVELRLAIRWDTATKSLVRLSKASGYWSFRVSVSRCSARAIRPELPKVEA